MTPWVTAALALTAAGAGYLGYGWQGLALAATVVVFALLLQFNRVMRVMRTAAQAPIGTVQSAVMLQSKLQPGMRLLDLVRLTGSLGVCEQDGPEQSIYSWRDGGGVSLRAEFHKARLHHWTLERPGASASTA